jgi:alkane 1-monooxygenase
MVEHYRGHHPRAATFEDPASSRCGENVYAFWFRTVSGSFISAWRLEAQRLQQMKKSWLQSPLAWAFGINVLLSSAFIAFGAAKLVAYWLAMGVVAFTLLELVNYIEHYGLQRKSIDGKREAFQEMHAWNADHWFTNTLLANLQRHSDHHTRAWKPYASLDACPPPAPQLPTGYAGCLILALIPPVWFAVMHKRLDAMKNDPAAVQPQ